MYAVVAHVAIPDHDTARDLLEDEGSALGGMPGVVGMYWLEPIDSGGNGLAIVVFETEQAARDMASMVTPGARMSEHVTIESMEVRHVLAHSGSDTTWSVQAPHASS
jgi:hypothetical protein